MTDTIIPFEPPKNSPLYKYQKSLKRLHNLEAHPTRWMCRNIVAEGEVSILSADAGAGKTQFAVALCAWLTQHHRNVVYMSPEVNFGLQVVRQFQASRGNMDYFQYSDEPFNLKEIADMFPRMISSSGNENGAASLYVLDTFQDFAGGANTWVDHEITQVMLPLRHAVQKTDKAVLILAHNRKDQSGSKQHRLSGSAQITAQAGQVLLLERNEGRDRRLEIAKSNIGPDEGEMLCQLDPLPGGQDGVMMSWSSGSPEHWNAPYKPPVDENGKKKKRNWNDV